MFHMRYSPPLSLPLVAVMILLGFMLCRSSAFERPPSEPCSLEEFGTRESVTMEWTECPSQCTCSDTDIQLQCRRPDLPKLADDDATCLRAIVVKDLRIPHLQADDLSRLKNLQELTMSDGRISKIADDAFMNLKSLERVDLTNNEIVEIPVDAFIYNKKLKWLVLSRNPLHVPSLRPLLRSESLRSLSMETCGITSLGVQTFAGVPYLSEINLRDNQLTEFPTEAVSYLKWLCNIDVDEMKNVITDDGYSDVTVVTQNSTGVNILYIFLTSIVSVVILGMLAGVYKISKTMVCWFRRNQEVGVRENPVNQSNNLTTNGRTDTSAPLFAVTDSHQRYDGSGGYHIHSQRQLRPLLYERPEHVYNDVEYFSASSRGRNSHLEDVRVHSRTSRYRRPADSLPSLPPPYDYRLPPRQDCVATSTSDLHTPFISDNANE